MTTRYYIRMWNDVTSASVIEGPITSELAAIVRAIGVAKTCFGSADVTWHERLTARQFLVGRRFQDETRSPAFVGIAVHKGQPPDAQGSLLVPYAGPLHG